MKFATLLILLPALLADSCDGPPTRVTCYADVDSAPRIDVVARFDDLHRMWRVDDARSALNGRRLKIPETMLCAFSELEEAR